MRFVAVLAAVLCLASAARADVVYDALADYSTVSNPNGPWSYGWSSGPLDGTMTVYPDYILDGGVYEVWRDNGHLSLGTPSVWRRSDLNTLNFHPGPDAYSIIRWVAPAAGSVDWDASFLSVDGGTKDVLVYHNTTQLFAAAIGGSSAAGSSGTLSVNAGDSVYVAVGRRDDYFSDATQVDFSISVPEPASLGLVGLGGLLVLRRRGR
jgi:hypothetical protein